MCWLFRRASQFYSCRCDWWELLSSFSPFSSSSCFSSFSFSPSSSSFSSLSFSSCFSSFSSSFSPSPPASHLFPPPPPFYPTSVTLPPYWEGQRFRSTRKWRCVVGWVIPYIFQGCSAFVFKVKQSQKQDSLTLKMKAVWSSYTSVTIYQSSWHNIPQDLNHRQHCCGMAVDANAGDTHLCFWHVIVIIIVVIIIVIISTPPPLPCL